MSVLSISCRIRSCSVTHSRVSLSAMMVVYVSIAHLRPDRAAADTRSTESRRWGQTPAVQRAAAGGRHPQYREPPLGADTRSTETCLWVRVTGVGADTRVTGVGADTRVTGVGADTRVTGVGADIPA